MPIHRERHRFYVLVALVAVAPMGALAWEPSPLSVKPAIELRYPGVPWVTGHELSKELRKPEQSQPILLDVRTAEEFAVSHLKSASRVSPGATNIAALQLPRNKPIVVYCSLGFRSAALAKRLQAAGYTNIRNLSGGIFHWAHQHRPLYRTTSEDKQRAQHVHPYDSTWGRFLQPQYHPPASS